MVDEEVFIDGSVEGLPGGKNHCLSPGRMPLSQTESAKILGSSGQPLGAVIGKTLNFFSLASNVK